MTSSTSSKMLSHGLRPSLTPQRPFAGNSPIQGENPAGSSTSNSSIGHPPFTSRDDSHIGMRSKVNTSDVGSAFKARGLKTRAMFEYPRPICDREWAKTDLTNEERTRERRRKEAKAAIELGRIVNGRGPLTHDDSDEDVAPRGRNPAINVTMKNGAQGMMQPGWAAWQQPMATMVPPQFSNDPAYLAAHRRALLVAKRAYQMVVAQHAMQIASEEWERSSNIGFRSGGSLYGRRSGGSGGSIYSNMGGMAPMGTMGTPNMAMFMPPNQWARSSVAFPSPTASVYGGISSPRGAYGDSLGPSSSCLSYVGNDIPNSVASVYGGSSRSRAWTGVTPSKSTPSAQPTRTIWKSPVRSRAAPPSSWKSGR